MPSQTFGNKKPYKPHLNRGSGGVQAEITRLRGEVDQAFLSLETDGHLAKFTTSATSPTVNNDSSEGYSIFSRWVDTVLDREFVCLDASTGAAVWVETTAAGGGGSASAVLNDSTVPGLNVALALDYLNSFLPNPALATVLDLYVDPVAGNDANTGLSTSQAIQTITRLNELLAPFAIEQYRPVLVHLASGALLMSVPVRISSKPTFSICFYGDPAWDPRGDLFTVIASGAADVGTGASTCVGTGFTINASRGYTFEWLTGAAVGQRRTVRGNSATSIVPVAAWNPVPASGDTWRVVRSNAVLQGAQITPPNASTQPTVTGSPGVCFCNVEVAGTGGTGAVGLGTGSYQIRGLRHRSAGSATISFAGSVVQAGLLSSTIQGGMLAQFGFPENLWTGWGLSGDGTGNGPNGNAASSLTGYVVHPGSLTLGYAFGFVSMNGGHLGQVFCNAGSRIIAAGTVGDSTSTTARLNLQGGDLQVSGNGLLVEMTSASVPAISIERGSKLLALDVLTGSNLGTGPSMRARLGGQCFVNGALNFGRASGDANPNDIVCEATAANKTSLTALGTYVRDATKPESLIARTA